MDEQAALEREVARSARATGLLAPGARVLVAVSGGADSTALLLLLAAARRHGLPLDLVVAHLDHGWRGAREARRDREHVEAVTERLGLPLHTAGPPDPPAPTEDAARRWRYAELSRLAADVGAEAVATGHHLRDQAETVLLRLLRGSGPTGLRGIPRERALGPGGALRVVRPILSVAPGRLRALLEARRVRWVEDPGNLDVSRDRARIRARLHAAKDRGAAASRHLARFAERLRRRLARQEAVLEAELGPALVLWRTAPAVVVPRSLLVLPGARFETAMRLLGRRLDADRDGPWLTRRHLRLCRQLVDIGGSLDLPRGLAFRVTGRRAWLYRREGPAPALAPVVRVLPATRFDVEAWARREGAEEAALDLERVGPRPRLRLVRPEDRFRPWGAPTEAPLGVLTWAARLGVPRDVRRRLQVLEGASGIAWVPGARIDADHAVSDATERVAIVSLAAARPRAR